MKSPYDQRIKEHPEDAKAYYERGIYFLEEPTTLDLAKKDFWRCIDLGDFIADSYSNLALIYDMENDPSQAQVLLEKAVEADPEHTVSWFALGTLHSIYGNHEQALYALARVLAIEMDFHEEDEYLEEDVSFSMEAFALRARIYLEKNENALALAECQASRAFDAEQNECDLLEIVALVRLNQTKEAKKLLQTLLNDEDIALENLKEHPVFSELQEFL